MMVIADRSETSWLRPGARCHAVVAVNLHAVFERSEYSSQQSTWKALNPRFKEYREEWGKTDHFSSFSFSRARRYLHAIKFHHWQASALIEKKNGWINWDPGSGVRTNILSVQSDNWLCQQFFWKLFREDISEPLKYFVWPIEYPFERLCLNLQFIQADFLLSHQCTLCEKH